MFKWLLDQEDEDDIDEITTYDELLAGLVEYDTEQARRLRILSDLIKEGSI